MMSGCKVEISGLIDDPAWDDFVAGAPGGHHVQTARWARVKASLGWEAVRVTVTESGNIVGGAQMLLRRLPLVGAVGYVSKGPLCADPDPALAETILGELIEAGRTNKCRLIAVQPPDNGRYLCGMLEAMGFCESGLELAPTATVVIDLRRDPDEILACMKRETRHRIRRSEKHGIVVREGDDSDLDVFYRLYLKTAERQGFMPFQPDYFHQLWRAFTPAGWIALLIASLEGEPVSAQLLIPFGDTVMAKMVGWSGEHSSLRPNDALFWQSILWARGRGFSYFDFEGVNPSGARVVLDGGRLPETPGLAQDIIKYGYGGKVVICPPAYDYLPDRTFNWLYRRVSRATRKFPLACKLVEYLRKRGSSAAQWGKGGMPG